MGKLSQGVIPLLQNFEMNLMPILFCYIFQVKKFDTFSRKCGEKQEGSAFKVAFQLS